MFVLFDDDNCFSSGDTLDDALVEWSDAYGPPIDVTKVRIVQGVEKKATITLIDMPTIGIEVKPTPSKSVPSKSTASKSPSSKPTASKK